MSERDRVESPIEAQMVAPPASYQPAADAEPHKQDALFDRPWFIVVLILHVGALGIPAYWRTRYSLGTRVMLVVVSIVYTVIAVAIIAWGLMQIWQLF